eukprot:jgi/Hompol1/7009/HPOL_005164-RA
MAVAVAVLRQSLAVERHWVDKNCLPWARQYFISKLTGLEYTENGTKVSITEVTSVEGDVDLNQRKGKVISIFDIVLSMTWKGVDESGNEATGKLNIPEFMHDTDIDDIVCEVIVDADSKSSYAMKEMVRKKLAGVIRKAFSTFVKDLFEAHSKDVYIPPEDMKKAPTPATSYQPKPPVAASEPTTEKIVNKEKVLGALTSITQRIEFNASPQDIYFTLLDKQRVSAWTRNNAEIGMLPGSPFSLFGGNVVGQIVSLTAAKRIEMKWRLKTWPEGHHSTVVIYLEEGDGQTILMLTQSGVPISEKEVTMQNWSTYYWTAIKTTFGFGLVM